MTYDYRQEAQIVYRNEYSPGPYTASYGKSYINFDVKIRRQYIVCLTYATVLIDESARNWSDEIWACRIKSAVEEALLRVGIDMAQYPLDVWVTSCRANDTDLLLYLIADDSPIPQPLSAQYLSQIVDDALAHTKSERNPEMQDE